MKSDNVRVNHQIRIPSVMVVKEGQNMGVMKTSDAMRLAVELGLDLVEVSPNNVPPVCKIMDYGKYCYELSIKQKQQNKQNKSAQLKQVKLRPVTDEHDLDRKSKEIQKFVEEGHPVRINMKFKSSELHHKELGFKLLNDILVRVSEVAQVRDRPSMQNKTLSCLIVPLK